MLALIAVAWVLAVAVGDLAVAHGCVRGDGEVVPAVDQLAPPRRRKLSRTSPGTFSARAISSSARGHWPLGVQHEVQDGAVEQGVPGRPF